MSAAQTHFEKTAKGAMPWSHQILSRGRGGEERHKYVGLSF
jgi:hypothetical protein